MPKILHERIYKDLAGAGLSGEAERLDKLYIEEQKILDFFEKAEDFEPLNEEEDSKHYEKYKAYEKRKPELNKEIDDLENEINGKLRKMNKHEWFGGFENDD